LLGLVYAVLTNTEHTGLKLYITPKQAINCTTYQIQPSQQVRDFSTSLKLRLY